MKDRNFFTKLKMKIFDYLCSRRGFFDILILQFFYYKIKKKIAFKTLKYEQVV